MTGDPLPVGRGIPAGLIRAREAIREVPVREPVDVDDAVDLDGEDINATLLREAHARREYRWHTICPQKFHGVSWDWVEAEHGAEIVETLHEWAALAPRPNLVVAGPIGTGKTGTVLTAVRDDFLERGLDVAFWPVVDLLDDMRPGGGNTAKGTLTETSRLILDDLGAERPTDWTWERLYALVNRRWLDERPTIVTTNLPVVRLRDGDDSPLLRDVVGERVYSRLVGENAVVIELLGRDRRRG